MKTPISQLSPYPGNARPSSVRAGHPHEGGAGANPNVRSRDGPPYHFDDRVVSLDEASSITGLSKDTLRRCHEREELEIIQLSPRRRGIRLSRLWAFIEARAA
jgi:hypothetical protein